MRHAKARLNILLAAGVSLLMSDIHHHPHLAQGYGLEPLIRVAYDGRADPLEEEAHIQVFLAHDIISLSCLCSTLRLYGQFPRLSTDSSGILKSFTFLYAFAREKVALLERPSQSNDTEEM